MSFAVVLVGSIAVSASPGQAGNDVSGPVRALFDRIDLNGDERLSRKEIEANAQIFRNFGELDHASNVAEPDWSKRRSDAVSTDATSSGSEQPAQGLERLIVDRADLNGDGRLSDNEISRFVSKSLRDADANGDGDLSRGEFAKAVGAPSDESADAGADDT